MLEKAGIIEKDDHRQDEYGITRKGDAHLFTITARRARAKKFYREWGPSHGYPLPPEERDPLLHKWATKMAKHVDEMRKGNRRRK